MSANWPLRPLSEIVEFKTGRLDSNASEDGGEYPFFTCSPKTLAINTFAFDDEAVLLAGNNANGVFAVKYYKGKFNAYQRTYVITPKDKTKLSVRWLYFRIKHVTSELQQMSVGTATKFLTKKILDSYEVFLPPYEEQERVADILWSLQDKIDVNRQTNQTLEDIAQTIFKSWFVDFEPTRAKIAAKENGQDPERAAMAAISGKTIDELDYLNPEQQKSLKSTAALFPDTLTDSELGQIPEGWEVKSIGDIVKRLKPKKRYTKKQIEPFGSIPVYEQGAGILLGFHNDEAGFLASSGEPLFIFGDHTCVVHLSCEDFDISQNVIPLAGNKYPTIWVYYSIQGKQEFQEYRRHWSEFIIKKVVAPQLDVAIAYAEFVTLLYTQKEQLVKECKGLEQVRDALLPKLLSGELEVIEKEKAIANG